MLKRASQSAYRAVLDRSSPDEAYIREGEYTGEINGCELSINVDSRTELRAFRHTKNSESEILTDITAEVTENDIVYDIGAHIGLHTCVLGTAVPEATIVSFEPYPLNAAQLLQNAHKNDVDVSLVSIAVSDEQGYLTMSGFSDEIGSSTGAASLDDGTIDSDLTVCSISGDQFVSESEFSPPDIVKIDVEGAEPLVIEGMEQTLSSDSCRALYCEVHLPSESGSSIVDYGVTKDELFQTIRKCGFSIEVLNKRDTRVPTMHIKATKQE